MKSTTFLAQNAEQVVPATACRNAQVTSSFSAILSPSERYGDVYTSGEARVQLGNIYIVNDVVSTTDVRQHLLARLGFPQMSDRKAQISNACPETLSLGLRQFKVGSYMVGLLQKLVICKV